jgi:hypothetical protein
MKPTLQGVLRYLWLVLTRFKGLLGGGSILVVGAGVLEHFTQLSVHWVSYCWVMAGCLGVALFLQGMHEHSKLIPRLRVPAGLHEQKAPDGSFRLFYFGVENISGTTVENVSVRLVGMVPPVSSICWLPISLHIKHDNDMPFKTQMKLNPGELRCIDLVQKSTASPNLEFWLVPPVANVAPPGRYELTVEVTGDDVPISVARFEAWLDHGGLLRCVIL